MTRKISIFLLFAVSWSTMSSACTTVEQNPEKEVVFDDGGPTAGKEISISDSDVQKAPTQIITAKPSIREADRTLRDRSQVETWIDGFGNKTETRYFKDNPRLRFIILRTSVDGTKVVTVYGYGSDTQTFNDLGDTALTASADDIANAAKLTATRSYLAKPNFMKRSKTQTPAVQPLPSSTLPIKPVQPIEQPKAKGETESGNSSEIPENQPGQN